MDGTPPVEPSPSAPSASGKRRLVRALLVAAILVAALLGVCRFSISGRFYGLFLLSRASGRPLELKDDLKLGDGPRLIGGVSFNWARKLLSRDRHALPRVELDWDEKDGGGIVTNYLEGGEVVRTVFGRYAFGETEAPQGLFVGGASADVAAGTEFNESGMALRDGRGWHHLWCNVNEAMQVAGQPALVIPAGWRFLGSQVLVDAPGRVVIESEHEVAVSGGTFRMQRFAYFLAGRPWVRLGINVMNVGDDVASITYVYGDEPWVGDFGSAAGNYGWNARGVMTNVAIFDPRALRWGGILDAKSGVANFIAWWGLPPDLAFVNNRAGTPAPDEIGRPLDSNEVFIGLEWRDRSLEPGETLSLELTLGLAVAGPDGLPAPPPGAIKAR